jgi:hypothetical protein
MSIGTEECKQAIIDYCQAHKQEICVQFDPPLDDKQFAQTLLVKSWKRFSKTEDGGIIERAFDCRPFDDQLRAYVRASKTAIYSVVVQGE